MIRLKVKNKTDMHSEKIKIFCSFCGRQLTGSLRVLYLLLFALFFHLMHFMLFPFPKRDSLTYLHILHYWNTTGSFAQVLEKFPKFGLLLFTFLPLKWAEQTGIPLYPASVVWMILMSMVSVWTFYKIVHLLTGSIRKAVCCGALFAVHPMILTNTGFLYRDTPYVMFLLLHVLCFILIVQTRKRIFMLLSGVTLALCLLSRFEAWELLLCFPLYAFFYIVKNRFEKKEIWHFVLLAAAGLSVTLIVMFAAVGDLPLLYVKGKTMFLSYFPKWMGMNP